MKQKVRDNLELKKMYSDVVLREMQKIHPECGIHGDDIVFTINASLFSQKFPDIKLFMLGDQIHMDP
ncbi:MAG: hypothetical protein FWC20_00695 [Oscillospiraceae bacterium]|nr:hypothetical protein [Oscillospiraceae bacterium]MCL2277911.1 hypothetical protein [Oscillospiraceae bacterium]